MLSWLTKIAMGDRRRIERNIRRLEDLQAKIHDLGYFVMASNSGGFRYLESMLDDQLIKGRPNIEAKLREALIGENNQKIALDAPHRFTDIMDECELIVQNEIVKEKRKLIGVDD